MKTQYEFAVLKQVLNNDEEIYTPVVRRWHRFLPAKWERIICIYGMYMLQDLDFTPNLTYSECEKHIVGYQDVLIKRKERNIKLSELHKLEKTQI